MRRAIGILPFVMLAVFIMAACAGPRSEVSGAGVSPSTGPVPRVRATSPANMSPAPSVDAAFAKWLKDFKADAARQGIRQATIDRALKDIHPVQKILERDRNQPEFTLTLDIYRSRVITPTNIAVGRRKLAQYEPLLQSVAAKYGVQPRFIVAIWGIETRYGAVKPTSPVIPALATLAFDTRRPDYFRNELMQALRMLDAGYAAQPELNGSWAGAMGQPQFMPSSYMDFAQDWDGDGRRDIWENPGDVFASIANYLASNGWSGNETWGRPVLLAPELRERLVNLQRQKKSGCKAIDLLTETRSLPEWQAMGVRRVDGSPLPTRDIQASLVMPELTNGQAFLVYRNYESILRYNCAHFYALTVGALSDMIGGG